MWWRSIPRMTMEKLRHCWRRIWRLNFFRCSLSRNEPFQIKHQTPFCKIRVFFLFTRFEISLCLASCSYQQKATAENEKHTCESSRHISVDWKFCACGGQFLDCLYRPVKHNQPV